VNPTAFARLLEDPERAGVYHLTPGGMEALTEACLQADLELIRVPLKETPRMADALETLTKASRCPAHEGAHLDDLSEMLSDFSWLPASGYVVLVEDADNLIASDPTGVQKLLEAFQAASHHWQALEIPFWVFIGLRGDGIALLPMIG
jgi:Barstar (barnase inhibitor)